MISVVNWKLCNAPMLNDNLNWMKTKGKNWLFTAQITLHFTLHDLQMEKIAKQANQRSTLPDSARSILNFLNEKWKNARTLEDFAHVVIINVVTWN